MKICHLITRMILGGAQENTLLTLEGLKRDTSHDIHLAYGPELGEEGSLIESCRELKIALHPLQFLRRDHHPLDDLRAYRELKDYFSKEKFDLVHTHSSKAGILGRFAAKKAGVPYIIHTIHGLAFDSLQPWWKNLLYIQLERKTARYCQRMISVCETMTNQALAAQIGTPSLYKTIYSGFPLEPFLNLKPKSKSNRFVVGMIARMVPMKGYEDLMQIVPSLMEKWSDLDFLIVGDGPFRKEVESWLNANPRFKNRFQLTGRVPASRIPSLLEQMDMFVHLSWREGLARVIAQALAASRPVCVYDIGGAREIVKNNETGWILPAGDLNQVASIIESVKTNPSQAAKLAARGRDLVKNLFDVKTMQNEIIQLYKEIGLS